MSKDDKIQEIFYPSIIKAKDLLNGKNLTEEDKKAIINENFCIAWRKVFSLK